MMTIQDLSELAIAYRILLATIGCFLIAFYSLTTLLQRTRTPQYERVGMMYDSNGELMWICRSSKEIFTIKDGSSRGGVFQRRRMWSEGGVDVDGGPFSSQLSSSR